MRKQFHLTEREIEALNLIGQGKEPEDLPEAMGLSIGQSDGLVNHLLRKMHVPSVRFLRNLSNAARRSTVQLPQYVRCDPPVGCGDSKPLAWFPHWPMQAVCLDCLARYEDKTKEQARWERARKAFGKIVSETKAVKISVPKIQELLATAYDEFGGASEYVKILTNQMKIACELRPGSKSTIDAMMALLKLNMEVNRFDAQEDEKRLSDDDLKDAMWSLVQQRMNEGLLDEAKQKVYDEFMLTDNDAGTDVIEYTEPSHANE